MFGREVRTYHQEGSPLINHILDRCFPVANQLPHSLLIIPLDIVEYLSIIWYGSQCLKSVFLGCTPHVDAVFETCCGYP
jgi:hypothetical protein